MHMKKETNKLDKIEMDEFDKHAIALTCISCVEIAAVYHKYRSVGRCIFFFFFAYCVSANRKQSLNNIFIILSISHIMYITLNQYFNKKIRVTHITWKIN